MSTSPLPITRFFRMGSDSWATIFAVSTDGIICSATGVGPNTVSALFSSSDNGASVAELEVHSWITLALNFSALPRYPSNAPCSAASCFCFCAQHLSFSADSRAANSPFLPPVPSSPCNPCVRVSILLVRTSSSVFAATIFWRISSCFSPSVNTPLSSAD